MAGDADIHFFLLFYSFEAKQTHKAHGTYGEQMSLCAYINLQTLI